MSNKRERHLASMGLVQDLKTGNFRAVDRVSLRALKNIKPPKYDTGERPAQPPGFPTGEYPAAKLSTQSQKLIDTGKLTRVREKEQIPEERNPMRILSPPAVARLLSEWHFTHFHKDLEAITLDVIRRYSENSASNLDSDTIAQAFADPKAFDAGQFIMVKYQVGKKGEPSDFYQKYPLQINSWESVEAALYNHIMEDMGDPNDPAIGNIPLRLAFFHRPHIYVQDPVVIDRFTDEETMEIQALTAPLSFGTWMRFTAKEFTDYVVALTPEREEGESDKDYDSRMEAHVRHINKNRKLPGELRIGFDAEYFFTGDEAELRRAFSYTRHLGFYQDICQSFASFVTTSDIDRGIKSDDLPFRILDAYSNGMADRVLTAWRERGELDTIIHRPQMELVISPTMTQMYFRDKLGVLKEIAENIDPENSRFDLFSSDDGIMLMRND